jgi:hypothetical protein
MRTNLFGLRFVDDRVAVAGWQWGDRSGCVVGSILSGENVENG